MFSQIRFHGGSNHLLAVPTGVLQRLYAAASPETNALGGGVVDGAARVRQRLDAVLQGEGEAREAGHAAIRSTSRVQV